MLDIAKMGDIVEIIAKSNAKGVQTERPEGYAHSSSIASTPSVREVANLTLSDQQHPHACIRIVRVCLGECSLHVQIKTFRCQRLQVQFV